jgi:predicted nucleotide-binding protein
MTRHGGYYVAYGTITPAGQAALARIRKLPPFTGAIDQQTQPVGMDPMERRNADRQRFLEALYDLTAEDPDHDAFDERDLGRRIGLSDDAARAASSYLADEGGLERTAFFGGQSLVRITHTGTKQVELSRVQPHLGGLESPPAESMTPCLDPDTSSVSTRVFVVHGHDEGAKHAVARFIEQMGLEPVILHERANEGRTIIEKFDRHTDIAFAVVLLIPDDVGGLVADRRSPSKLRSRAGQNVVLELGYFIGKLGRSRVCALYVDSVETPSDIDGFLYVPMDRAGAWKPELGKELHTAGLPVDLNRLVQRP